MLWAAPVGYPRLPAATRLPMTCPPCPPAAHAAMDPPYQPPGPATDWEVLGLSLRLYHRKSITFSPGWCQGSWDPNTGEGICIQNVPASTKEFQTRVMLSTWSRLFQKRVPGSHWHWVDTHHSLCLCVPFSYLPNSLLWPLPHGG